MLEGFIQPRTNYYAHLEYEYQSSRARVIFKRERERSEKERSEREREREMGKSGSIQSSLNFKHEMPTVTVAQK